MLLRSLDSPHRVTKEGSTDRCTSLIIHNYGQTDQGTFSAFL